MRASTCFMYILAHFLTCFWNTKLDNTEIWVMQLLHAHLFVYELLHKVVKEETLRHLWAQQKELCFTCVSTFIPKLDRIICLRLIYSVAPYFSYFSNSEFSDFQKQRKQYCQQLNFPLGNRLQDEEPEAKPLEMTNTERKADSGLLNKDGVNVILRVCNKVTELFLFVEKNYSISDIQHSILQSILKCLEGIFKGRTPSVSSNFRKCIYWDTGLFDSTSNLVT